MANRPGELWHLLQLATGSQTWGSPIDFRVRYAGASHDGFGWRDGLPSHTTELQLRLRRAYLRRTIDEIDALELPSLTRQLLTVPLDDAEEVAHAKALGSGEDRRRLLAFFRHGGAGAQTLKMLHRLQGLTSNAKLGATESRVRSILEGGEAVLCFTATRKTADRLGLRLLDGRGPTYVVHGGHPAGARDEWLDAFQAGDGPGVVVATIDALKEGVTLTRARHVVFHDLPWRPTDVLQGERRVHRIGQAWPCTSTWVVADDSFDSLILQAYREKAHAQVAGLDFTATQEALDELGVGLGPSLEDAAATLLAGWQGDAA
jgi:SNF2 family DNA or RNA helicase